ncbi:hypothetical protein OAB00_02260 [Akkermansiaceae bacterium]|nr:hypothetical protein [Akkermansiaceae bacterium]
MQLSDSLGKRVELIDHQEKAKANAKLALAKSLALMTETIGRDQAVCAEADIFYAEGVAAQNRHWLGVWKTTHYHEEAQWPMIGKLSSSASRGNEPYRLEHFYNDLREDIGSGGRDWRRELLSGWMVSGDVEKDSYLTELTEAKDTVTLLGKGGLKLDSDSEEYEEKLVRVPLVDINDGTSNGTTGRYGFWVTNNNLKANITAGGEDYGKPNPTNIDIGLKNVSDFSEEILSLESIELANVSVTERISDKALANHYHDFTNFSYGMQINTRLGGFKKDLTAVVFGVPGVDTLELMSLESLDNSESEENEESEEGFSSRYPIIPSPRKTVLGPRFETLRNWGQLRELAGYDSGNVTLNFQVDEADLLERDGSEWGRSVSDGVTLNPLNQSGSSMQLRPTMSGAAWHFGFSYTGEGITNASDADGSSQLRFHIMPKVKLWNPYHIAVRVPETIVLMPNILTRDDGNLMRFEFYLEDDFVENVLKVKHSFLANWSKSYVNGERLYKLSVGGGIVPQSRYLGFILEPEQLYAGECLVYSASVSNDLAVNPDGEILMQELDELDTSNNRLSARSSFGRDHFVHEVIDFSDVMVGSRSEGRDLSDIEAGRLLRDIDFSKVFRYKFDGVVKDTMTFVHKANNEKAELAADDLASTTALDYPTLQLFNAADGGVITDEWYASNFFVDPTRSNSYMLNTEANGNIEFPQAFQIGAKLISLQERYYEADPIYSFRTRYSAGLKPNSMLFNYGPISSGNVRASMITRAPHHFATRWWGSRAMGNWMLAHASPSPSETWELPFIRHRGVDGDGLNVVHIMSPLHEAGSYRGIGDTVLFDVPDIERGCVAITSLRHAKVSPYSWHPSYVVGNSLADLSSPLSSTGHAFLEQKYDGREMLISQSFDYYAGGVESASRDWSTYIDWGPETETGMSSDSLLFIGKNKLTEEVAGMSVDSADEILTYDLSYEVNLNLYDDYFFSTMPLVSDTSTSLYGTDAYEWDREESLSNQNLSHNAHIPEGVWNSYEEELASGDSMKSLSSGFWKNGFFLKCENQFNLNSVSVNAWAAVLSSLRNDNGYHPVSRLRLEESRMNRGVKTENLEESDTGGLRGARQLSDEEIMQLAKSIVKQVKVRGPFMGVADFVNRRLSEDGEINGMGALEAAIKEAGLNEEFDTGMTQYSYEHGVKLGGRDYNVHEGFKPDFDAILPASKSHGLPSYITQGDILEKLDPYLSARGEAFTIRCYGQSVADSEVKGEAYLEAVVIRLPMAVGVDTMSEQVSSQIEIAPVTGVPTHKEVRKHGRQFKILKIKWLNKSEI